MSRFDQAITAVTFMLLGPLAGGLGFWLIALSAEVSVGRADALTIALDSLQSSLMFAYMIGFLPALLAGFFFAALPLAWQRITVSFIVGAAASLLFGATVNALGQLHIFTVDIAVVYASAGAVAAVVSAFTTRQLLKSLGRTYQYGGDLD